MPSISRHASGTFFIADEQTFVLHSMCVLVPEVYSTILAEIDHRYKRSELPFSFVN
jgi:hypothetical protein